MKLQFEIIIGLFLEALVAGESRWSYTGEQGPNTWATNYPECGSKRQSPINIETGSVKVEYWQPLNFTNYHIPPDTMIVKNNGHTATVVLEGGVDPIVSQGGLEGEYVFAQLHFHWGSDSAEGSEHTIDSVRYPLEMHLVHSKESALNTGNGRAVIGVLFELGETDNAALTPLINALLNISDAGNATEVSSPYAYPLQAYLPDDTRKFYRYEGSLTTPPCSEDVIWTLFHTTAKVSENQLSALRALKTEDDYNLVDNYRPPQPLNERQVLVSDAQSVLLKKMSFGLLYMSTLVVIVMSI